MYKLIIIVLIVLGLYLFSRNYEGFEYNNLYTILESQLRDVELSINFDNIFPENAIGFNQSGWNYDGISCFKYWNNKNINGRYNQLLYETESNSYCQQLPEKPEDKGMDQGYYSKDHLEQLLNFLENDMDDGKYGFFPKTDFNIKKGQIDNLWINKDNYIIKIYKGRKFPGVPNKILGNTSDHFDKNIKDIYNIDKDYPVAIIIRMSPNNCIKDYNGVLDIQYFEYILFDLKYLLHGEILSEYPIQNLFFYKTVLDPNKITYLVKTHNSSNRDPLVNLSEKQCLDDSLNRNKGINWLWNIKDNSVWDNKQKTRYPVGDKVCVWSDKCENATYDNANRKCSDLGGRLCRKDEIHNTHIKKCNSVVWSSTICPLNDGKRGKIVTNFDKQNNYILVSFSSYQRHRWKWNGNRWTPNYYMYNSNPYMLFHKDVAVINTMYQNRKQYNNINIAIFDKQGKIILSSNQAKNQIFQDFYNKIQSKSEMCIDHSDGINMHTVRCCMDSKKYQKYEYDGSSGSASLGIHRKMQITYKIPTNFKYDDQQYYPKSVLSTTENGVLQCPPRYKLSDISKCDYNISQITDGGSLLDIRETNNPECYNSFDVPWALFEGKRNCEKKGEKNLDYPNKCVYKTTDTNKAVCEYCGDMCANQSNSLELN